MKTEDITAEAPARRSSDTRLDADARMTRHDPGEILICDGTKWLVWSPAPTSPAARWLDRRIHPGGQT